jgi:hypothetical protein
LICDEFGPPKGSCLTLREFEAITQTASHSFEDVFEFFQGLTSQESRFRWDRLVCFHLLVMAFLNVFGYKSHYSEDEIAPNFKEWIHRLGLGDQSEAQRIIRALDAALARR